MEATFDFGIIGVGVMGSNLLLNLADHGFKVVGYDKDKIKTAALETAARQGTTVKGVNTVQDMMQLLKPPRKVMLLVPAGLIVDSVIGDLLPFVEKGDIIVDGGNSHYTDTLKRIKFLEDKAVHFMGAGISGGEEGARIGPSIMPGGDREAYDYLQPLFESVAAKVNDQPCVAYLGRHAAGHYVKMVHNGIEYSIMQLISEVYAILKQRAGLSNDELHEVFKKWNEGDLQSFLVEITAHIFKEVDPKTNNRLVDMILDKAGAKGTGKWTSQDALDLSVPIPSIDAAVTMRNISSLKERRVVLAELYKLNVANGEKADKQTLIDQLHDALLFGVLMSYTQGLAMLNVASVALDMQIDMQAVIRVWKGGCIIRSKLLNLFESAFSEDASLPNLLLSNGVVYLVKKSEANMRTAVVDAITSGIPCAGLAGSLNYFDAMLSAQLPVNLIQAQRDFFGAHTYERIDDTGFFHTEWNTVKP